MNHKTNKLVVIVCFTVMLFSFIACGGNNTISTDVNEPDITSESEYVSESEVLSEDTENVSDENTVSEELEEVSILEGVSYSFNFWSYDMVQTYTKAISGNQYSYTVNENTYNNVLGEINVYYDGTDLYVYTNKLPNGETLDEYVWIRNGENPYEIIEKELYSVLTPSNIEKLENKELGNLADSMPFIKSLGFDDIRLEYVKEDVVDPEVLIISFEINGPTQVCEGGFGANTRPVELVVPEITVYLDASDFESETSAEPEGEQM